MSDRLEFTARCRVGKNFLRHQLAIQIAAGGEDIQTEEFDKFRQGRAAGVDDFPGEIICTDQDGTACHQAIGDKTLSGGDASR